MENDGGKGSAGVGGWVELFWVVWCKKVGVRWLRRRDPREVYQAETSGSMVHLVEGTANAGACGSQVCPGAACRLRGGPVYHALVASGGMKVSGRLTSSCWAVEWMAEVGER